MNMNWITDRLPSILDADPNGFVLRGDGWSVHWKEVELGQAWQTMETGAELLKSASMSIPSKSEWIRERLDLLVKGVGHYAESGHWPTVAVLAEEIAEIARGMG